MVRDLIITTAVREARDLIITRAVKAARDLIITRAARDHTIMDSVHRDRDLMVQLQVLQNQIWLNRLQKNPESEQINLTKQINL